MTVSNLFSKASTWLPGMVGKSAGGTVSYRRGATSRTVPATASQTLSASNAEGPVRTEVGDGDYLILVSDLAAFGTPQIGDRITDAVGLVFEIQDTNTGDPAWRYTDTTRIEYRIHTKRVA